MVAKLTSNDVGDLLRIGEQFAGELCRQGEGVASQSFAASPLITKADGNPPAPTSVTGETSDKPDDES